MRPSLVVILLLLFTLMHQSQGIRLEKGFMQTRNQNLHEDQKGNSLTERNGVEESKSLCKEDQKSCTGMVRKLVTVSSSTPPTAISTLKKEKNIIGGNKAKLPKSKSKDMSSDHEGHDDEKYHEKEAMTHEDHYVDLMDIAEMDYSPARRKPPIHN